MLKAIMSLTLVFLVSYPSAIYSAQFSSGALEYTRDSTGPVEAADSYEHALHIWKRPEDINAWIATNFSYDTARAMRLSESQRSKNEKFSIYRPAEFFKRKTGVCVDLSRFSVETLRRIDPQMDPKYLMIEFNPIQIQGNMLRFHWMVSFKRGGKSYFFSDSKRPGHIAGPYNDTEAFIDEYEQYRGRKIIAFRELASYQKQLRTQALQLQATQKP
jgi:hypothetical protein